MITKPIRILLIENDAVDHSFVQDSLAEPSFNPPRIELVRANHFDQELIGLGNDAIDLVLLDISSSEQKGLSSIIQAHQQNPDVPIIVLAEQYDDLVTHALDIGAESYLAKDRLSSESLVYALLCAVERRRMGRQLQHNAIELQLREKRFQNLIIKNPDGVVVVDTQGIIQFINPAAEVLFERTTEDLVGELFGFPVIAGETTEIDIIRKETDYLNIAEMRVVETEWESERAYLITLRDISEHKRLRESLRYSEELNRLILHTIDSHIVVIDEQGSVVLMNTSWQQFTRGHDTKSFASIGVGANYFDACKEVFGETSRMLVGTKAVLQGKVSSFDFEYKHTLSTKEEFWYYIHITPLANHRDDHHKYMLVTYNDVTERKRVAWAEAEAKSNATRIKEQEREIRGLLQLTGSTVTAVTSSLFGTQPLSESAPLVFQELSRRYSDLIEMAMEQRAYKVDHGLSEELRSMAERLGFLKAGPRDVVEVHSKVLQTKSSGVTPQKMQAYTEEGRLMIIELMGHLVSYYRNHSLGISKSFVPKQKT